MNRLPALRRTCIVLQSDLFFPWRLLQVFQQDRSASLNSAIGRGIRRSRNAGAGREIRKEQDGIESETSNLRIRRGKKDITTDDAPEKRVRRSRAARYYDPNSRFGRRSLEHRKKLDAEKAEQAARERLASAFTSISKQLGRQRPQMSSRTRRSGVESIDTSPPMRTTPDSSRRGLKSGSQVGEFSQRAIDSAPADPTVRKVSFRDSVPISIPYTTPASEFLYGTSVVEAAMRSQRSPRRKLYKLYIYTGENREQIVRDADLERLAYRMGLQTVKLDNTSGLRMMDKMSGGRPHNGYILEASPLPRLPILSLGVVPSEMAGFRVILDSQSREDAAINGTSDFIPLPRMGRKPFILFLDGILDPGNLGGILRTAAFLGVTAVAVSVRHSASFTPVVLKSSAGASENIGILSVNKPAAFIQDSKKAGWKIYAAVAPSDGNTRRPIFTHELDDPLRNDPCVLMLGSEGEGLRTNLRSKAHREIAIRGLGRHHGVDSLNVSVAAGILCDAFLGTKRHASKATQDSAEDSKESLTLF